MKKCIAFSAGVSYAIANEEESCQRSHCGNCRAGTGIFLWTVLSGAYGGIGKPGLQKQSTASFEQTHPLLSDESFDGDHGKWLDKFETLKGTDRPSIELVLYRREWPKQ